LARLPQVRHRRLEYLRILGRLLCLVDRHFRLLGRRRLRLMLRLGGGRLSR
jgi:hypothetical protein